MSPTIHIVIPSIPPREHLLQRALASVAAQTWPVTHVHLEIDYDGRGAAPTRNVALRRAIGCIPYVQSAVEWIGFLDDDDELKPEHCEHLISGAIAENKGVAFGWFDVVDGMDPFPGHRLLPFDPEAPRCVPITWIARADVMAAAYATTGGFVEALSDTGYWSQDSVLLCEAVRLGGAYVSTERTWRWFHSTGNTSGRPWITKWPRKKDRRGRVR